MKSRVLWRTNNSGAASKPYPVGTICLMDGLSQVDPIRQRLTVPGSGSFYNIECPWATSVTNRYIKIVGYDANYYNIVEVKVDGTPIIDLSNPNSTLSPTPKGAVTMAVFTGVVVRTLTVPRGTGVTESVQKQEIIFEVKTPFVAADLAAAKGLILAEAARADKDLNLNDPIAPVTAVALQYQ